MSESNVLVGRICMYINTYIILAIKLKHIKKINLVSKVLKNKTGNSPILLLDDIFDKLDLIRVKRIVEIVNSTNFGQLFLSDTDRERIEKVLSSLNLSSKIFDV